jgi:hypothetical protein
MSVIILAAWGVLADGRVDAIDKEKAKALRWKP